MKYKEAYYKLDVLIDITDAHFDKHGDDINDWENSVRRPKCRLIYNSYNNLSKSMTLVQLIRLAILHPMRMLLLAGMTKSHDKAMRRYPEHYHTPERESEGTENA